MNVMMTPLEPVLKSHLMPLYIEQLQMLADQERRNREAFYDWITEDSRAEFINGEVIVESPAKDRHTVASMNLAFLLGSYTAEFDLGAVRAETTLIVLTRNDYLPDICFFGAEKAAQIEPAQMKYPAPDFIAEILSPSTEEKDRTTKFADYAAHGVQEYWLIDPEKEIVEQYRLDGDQYELLFKVGEGMVESFVIAGFKVPTAAIFNRKAANRALLQLLTRSKSV